MPEKGIFIKNSSLTILLSTFGLHFSLLLVKRVKDVACKSSHNNSYQKNECFDLYMFNVPCVIH